MWDFSLGLRYRVDGRNRLHKKANQEIRSALQRRGAPVLLEILKINRFDAMIFQSMLSAPKGGELKGSMSRFKSSTRSRHFSLRHVSTVMDRLECHALATAP